MKKTLLLISIFILMVIVTACGNEKQFETEKKDSDSILQIDPEAGSENIIVTLYFKHAYSKFLVPQEREIAKGNRPLHQVVLEELLKGPQADEGIDKVAVMPNEVGLIDINLNGNTAFVNLSEQFLDPIELVSKNKDTVITQTEQEQQELKLLSIYSIVNTLTEIPSIDQVKILVENKTITYSEAGAELIAEQLENVNSDMSMLSFSRDAKQILSPSDSAQLLLETLATGPEWDTAYAFLYKETQLGNPLPSREDIETKYAANVKQVNLEEAIVEEEEIRSDGTAFVTVNYSIVLRNGTVIEEQESNLTVVASNGIWKVKLPDEFLVE